MTADAMSSSKALSLPESTKKSAAAASDAATIDGTASLRIVFVKFP